MEDSEKLFQILKDITRRRASIHESTCVHHDLSISGDDAAELIERVHKTFGTSFDGFEFSSYFPNETEGLFYHFGKLFGLRSKKKRLSVGHLLSVIKAGHWFEESA
jgi:hypothetical protein